jgi:hypothetical protein
MTEHMVRKLDASRKLLLSSAGLVAIALPAVSGLVTTIPSRAQSQAASTGASAPESGVASIKQNVRAQTEQPTVESLPAFDVASVKSTKLAGPGGVEGQTGTNITVNQGTKAA